MGFSSPKFPERAYLSEHLLSVVQKTQLVFPIPLVYRILSESTESGYARFARDFDAAELSFRELTRADRQRIFEDRLHIETAREGETLSALLERVGSDWDLEEAAAANAIESSATFRKNDLVKVTRRKRFDSTR